MVAPEAAHILALRHDKRLEVAVIQFHSLAVQEADLAVEHNILDSDPVVGIEEEVRVDNRLVYMVVVPSNVCRT